MVCLPYLSARSGNCILNSTDVLLVSSAYKPAIQLTQPAIDQIKELEINDDDFYPLLEIEQEPYEEHLRAFIASTIEMNICKNISQKVKSACQDCLSVFSENPKTHDDFIARINRTKSRTQPCLSTIYIVSACDAVFKLLQSQDYVDFHVVAKTIFNHLDDTELYESSEFELHRYSSQQQNDLTHREQFTYDIILEYMQIKSKKIGKRITIEEQKGKLLRRKLTRSIILAGQ